MPLSVTSLNGDSTFLLTFAPSSKNGAPITILLDPWLHTAAPIIHPRFASQSLITVPVIPSLDSLANAKAKSAEPAEPAELQSEEYNTFPDAIILSQSDSDHCNSATLSEYPWSSTSTAVICSLKSATRIRSWRWWREGGHDRRLRILQPKKPLILNKAGFTAAGETRSGESKLEVQLLEPKYPWQIPSVHSAVAITFSSHEEVIRVLFSPHGSPWGCVKSWVGNKKLDLLLWPWNHVHTPWWLGGEVGAGFERGRKVCEATEMSHWIASHDDEKEVSGWVTRWMVRRSWGEERVREQLGEGMGLWRLKAGQVMTVGDTKIQ